jgi:hypothetical protein
MKQYGFIVLVVVSAKELNNYSSLTYNSGPHKPGEGGFDLVVIPISEMPTTGTR